MTLYDICKMISEVEEGLMYGNISFSYDNLMSAMKPGHPADILDDILSIIGWDVFKGETPEREKIEDVLTQLKAFKSCFKVKQLKQPIEALDNYLNPRILLSFPIHIEESGESFVEFAVTDKELQKIKKAIKNGDEFEEASGLKSLYGKVMRAAKRQIKEDIALTFDNIDFDDIEYCVDYPEISEDE